MGPGVLFLVLSFALCNGLGPPLAKVLKSSGWGRGWYPLSAWMGAYSRYMVRMRHKGSGYGLVQGPPLCFLRMPHDECSNQLPIDAVHRVRICARSSILRRHISRYLSMFCRGYDSTSTSFTKCFRSTCLMALGDHGAAERACCYTILLIDTQELTLLVWA